MNKFVVLFFAIAVACQAQDTVKDQDNPGIYRVRVFGRNNDWTATAFFISETKLLTAAHTFGKGYKRVVIFVDDKEVECKVIKKDSDEDVDACLLETIDYKSPKFCTLSDGVKVMGYPGEHSKPITTTGGKLEKLRTDNTLLPGMSGAPLMVGNLVIGMGVASDGRTSTDSCMAIPSCILKAFVDKP